MSSSLRMRLTLWYVGAFSVVLILFSAGVYFFVEHILRERMDANLRFTLQATTSALTRHAVPSSSSNVEGQVEHSSVADALEDPRFPGQIVAVVDADGRVLARRPASSTLGVRVPPLPLRASSSPKFYELPESNPDTDDSCRGIYQLLTPVSSSGPSSIIVVTTSMEGLSDQLDTLQNVLAIAIVLALLLSGGGGWFLARQSLSPVAAMASATERITANNLGERLPVGPSDELGRLASRFNDLLARLSASFSQQRQFMADASHELRTPLSVVRTAAQVALQKPERSDSEYREALAVIEKQAGHLSRIVQDMFALARADTGAIAVQSEEMYLDEVLTEAAQTVSVLANRKEICLEMPTLHEAPYRGDEGLLRQMFINLLDNAVKYTGEGGRVHILLERMESEYIVIISDTGIGIPSEAQPYIFDRFFRADKSRTQTMDGNGAGLGLSIARVIAEVHKGRLELQHSDSTGSTFSVSLPRS